MLINTERAVVMDDMYYFPSVMDAASEFGFETSNIYKACEKKMNHAYKHKWRWFDEWLLEELYWPQNSKKK